MGILGNGALHSCAEISRIAAGTTCEIVYRNDNGAVMVLPAEAGGILQSCDAWRTLAEHAQAIANDYSSAQVDGTSAPAPSVAAIESVLANMAAQGLLVNLDEVREAMRQPEGAPPRIGTLGIVTCDRPALLERCLGSFSENASRHGRDVEYVIADDSREEACRGANRALAGALGRRLGLRVRYAGRAQKCAFATRLERESGVPGDVVRFALFGPTGFAGTMGANRNGLLLDCAGEPVLSTDDDVVCRLSAAAEAGQPAAFARDEELLEFRFYPTHEEALASNAAAEVDLFSLHERFLGRYGWQCAAPSAVAAASGIPAASSCIHFGKRRVVASYTGILGDNAYDRPLVYLLLRGVSRTRLHCSERAYRDAYKYRQVMRAMRRPVIADGIFSTATLMGLDARTVLPPFVPMFRNEDTLFGMLARRSMPGCLFAHIPFAARHAPEPARTHENDDAIWRTPGCTTFCGILAAAIECGPVIPRGAGAADGLASVGRHLKLLGGLSDLDFQGAVRPTLLGMAAQYVDLIDESLNTHAGEPEYWARDTINHRGEIISALQDRHYMAPQELRSGRQPAEALECARGLVAKFGALVEHWPALFECSAELRRKGMRLSVDCDG
ncbi:MAG: hypothetical protein ACLQGV_00810 [Bryobacteraceae bacterium]